MACLVLFGFMFVIFVFPENIVSLQMNFDKHKKVTLPGLSVTPANNGNLSTAGTQNSTMAPGLIEMTIQE